MIYCMSVAREAAAHIVPPPTTTWRLARCHAHPFRPSIGRLSTGTCIHTVTHGGRAYVGFRIHDCIGEFKSDPTDACLAGI
jgi:hypothetical protein